MNKRYKRALTIAGFDGSGGAGIQADLKTFSALGCYGMSVLTALPVQNTQGVKSIYSISERCVEEQLQSILEDIGVDVIKIGMLHTPEIIERVAMVLQSYAHVPIVLDPVMIAKSGDSLISQEALAVMKSKLFPLATLLTPNLEEASKIVGRQLCSKEEMASAACELTHLGPQAVVVKGGHRQHTSCDDCLYSREGETHWFSSPRIATHNTHGTGCTFSAAIAAFLARGFKLEEAVGQAKHYLFSAIEAGAQFQIGHGHGPVHHFFSYWD